MGRSIWLQLRNVLVRLFARYHYLVYSYTVMPHLLFKGDSGGPLVCEHANKYYLHGVSSFGGATCGETPSAFQRISHHIDWILETTSGEGRA